MHLHLETEINAPADTAWQALGPSFAQIDEWASFVQTSRPIDRSEVPDDLTVDPTAPVPGRETTTKATLIEVLTNYDDAGRTLTFHGVGVPRIVTRARNVQSIRTTSPTTSTVVFEVDFDLWGPFRIFDPILRRRMAATFGDVQADLKRHAEHARV